MPRKGQKYVKKRKGFHGTRWADMKKDRNEEEELPERQTATERKLKLNNAPAAQNFQTGPTNRNPRQSLEGNYIISGPLLAAALQSAHVCPGGYLIPLENVKKRCGLNSNIILQCSECGAESSFMTSETVPGAGRCGDVNRKAAVAASEVGLGRVGLADLSSIMGLAPPPEQRSYQRHLKRVAKASDQACEEQMMEAANRLRERAREKDPSIGLDDIVDVAVSYDGQHKNIDLVADKHPEELSKTSEFNEESKPKLQIYIKEELDENPASCPVFTALVPEWPSAMPVKSEPTPSDEDLNFQNADIEADIDAIVDNDGWINDDSPPPTSNRGRDIHPEHRLHNVGDHIPERAPHASTNNRCVVCSEKYRRAKAAWPQRSESALPKRRKTVHWCTYCKVFLCIGLPGSNCWISWHKMVAYWE